MDSSSPKRKKSEKGFFSYDKTGWMHAIFISEQYFSSTALEFNKNGIKIIYQQAHYLE